jgi:hypothetical protein
MLECFSVPLLGPSMAVLRINLWFESYGLIESLESILGSFFQHGVLRMMLGIPLFI